ncbi:MAG: DNA-protecting protein DprA, partial [Gammaproteobacteria bacterium]|nr:DNA-protecting protein DprA [Gammaproteobacteria bacterium]
MTSLATLQLGLVPGITIRSIDGLMEQLGSAENIIGASASQLQQAGLSLKATDALKNPDTEQVKKCLKWAEQPERHIIAWTDDRYPCLLRETASSPPLLFIHGDPDLPAMPQLAIVGSRNATPGGLDTARRFAAHLARAGFCITSGLALGIDTSAHDAALNSGGKTIAVFGSGPDIIYPRENQMLAARIAENGALL